MKSPDDRPDLRLPRLMMRVLEEKGILHYWISEDYRAKKSYASIIRWNILKSAPLEPI